MRARVYRREGPQTIHFLLHVPEDEVGNFMPDISPEELEELLNATLHSDDVAPAVAHVPAAVCDELAPRQRFNAYEHLKSDSCQCSICLDTYTPRTRRYVRQLPCGHVFCASCIEKWMTTRSATCPTCRKPLVQ